MAEPWRGVRLEQVNTTDVGEAEPDVDIIAVHGLDAKSPNTWTWRPKDSNKPSVNWLADSYMLPALVQRVRIFTCDWPADLFQDSGSTPWTVEEFARRLLAGIQSMRHADGQSRDRPILFIASCLGGIILMKALVMADNPQSGYVSIRNATRGIVFLATPFRGTAFQDVAAWTEPFLKAWASLQHRSVTQLLNSVKGSTFDLEELVRAFTRLSQDKDRPCQVQTFYEKMTTILQSRVLPPYLLPLFGQAKLILKKIREGRPLEQADAWIRKHHYTADKLKIDRLSGAQLPMDQCYINLAIVEQVGHAANKDGPQAESFPFSLLARQKVVTPDKTIQVKLATMFNERQLNGQALQPRRILIRGRAGVGKTTLCKKIIHEFYRGTWSEWTKTFDRVLWIPLRNLKLPERQEPGYNFERLFKHEYFSLPTSRPDLARELSHALTIKDNKTLFLLDGLDEVSQDLGGASDMFRFLKELLKQPNVIITSRPSVKTPSGMDLELETIGFYSNQVDAYLDADPEIKSRANEVRSFLKKHRLIQGLVRIPIQLDALCYIWDDFDHGTAPDTMSGVYRAIEQRLWKKDAVRLGKISEALARSACSLEIEHTVETEIALLEFVAFNGMHSNVIEFTPAHQVETIRKFQRFLPLLLSATLARLSFLRASDSSPKVKNQSYHFSHLTFQEYFAARYFVRQWEAAEPLEHVLGNSQTKVDIDPVKFLKKHKYTARYDILWRFVAGLLSTKYQKALFQAIEEEPLDLLGPTHQRLVMHCLSEVPNDMPLRPHLEKRLMEWLLFECSFQESAQFSMEMEFPEPALRAALQEGSDDAKIKILVSLERRPILSPSFNELAPSLLGDGTASAVRIQVLRLLETFRTDLDSNLLAAIVKGLGDEHWDVRPICLVLLQQYSGLSKEIITAVAQRLGDEHDFVRAGALRVLQKQLSLSNGVLITIVRRLANKDEDLWVREIAREVLEEKSSLADKVLTRAVQQLGDEHPSTRKSALNILQGWASLSEDILVSVVKRLNEEHLSIRQAALKVLGRQSSLSEETLTVVTQLLENEHTKTRETALEVLRWGRKLSDEVLQALIQLLHDKQSSIQRAALDVLQKQSSLSDEIQKAVVQQLHNNPSSVRRAALDILQYQSSLSNGTLKAVVQQLQDKQPSIRKVVLGVLQNQSSLSGEILEAVVQQLHDKQSSIRCAALDVLIVQSRLSNGLLKAVVQQLHDKDSRTRVAALAVLQKQPSLCDEALTSIVQWHDNEDQIVQLATLEILQNQPSLSNEIILAIAQQHGNEHQTVRLATLKVLQKQPSLSDKILEAVIVQRLGDENSDVQRTALCILHKQSVLPGDTLATVARMLQLGGILGGLAERVLRKHEAFYSSLLNGPHLGPLFQVLMHRAFKQQWSWYIEDGRSCINMPDGMRSADIEDLEEFMDTVIKARPSGIPLMVQDQSEN
ncbi:hypothetical protein AK830_g10416 [Neonectria ditissima]|uniref:NACHT domain-containing protein n=1 Tax=Neonectria ditissima TaxID=78410 RepID=A0A0P7ATH2_9HYPO|nr:hypothetical protein AK830_g10416 [Neonectria ditissima]